MRRAKARGRDLRPLRAFALQLDHRHAMGVHGLADLLRRPGLHAVRMQQAVVDVFMVQHQQAAVRTVERKEGHAVVVHAGLQGLFVRRVGAIGLEGRHAARDAGGVAPAIEHLRAVALGHDDLVDGRHGHALEADGPAQRTHRAAGGGATGQRAGSQGAEKAGHRRGQSAAHEHPPFRVGHVVDRGVGGRVGVLHLRVVFGHLLVVWVVRTFDVLAKP
jgi:hypothetical protein